MRIVGGWRQGRGMEYGMRTMPVCGTFGRISEDHKYNCELGGYVSPTGVGGRGRASGADKVAGAQPPPP